ncbi:M55 family metallopeptidase [Kribbella sp. NPDC050820]|uniref:M55 family metallopeptidase n=1 Tax=Kribbella sp. NPDC050820 TaxID=3155408 RepID=UPI0033F2B9C9
MKVYLSVDMEGITGLVDAEDVQPPGRDYERGRVLMTEDTNAAIRGAYEAGATAVLVNDAHGPMRNLLPDLLDRRATLIKGRPKPMGMMEGLTSEYDAALCIGYHARAGVLGVLSHSFMGHEIEDIWLDDQVTGEIGLFHAAAAAYGVPVAMLTGDDTACAEMTAWDPNVAVVPVKYAKDRFAAELVPVPDAQAAIEQTAATALAALPSLPANLTSTRELTVRWQSASVVSHLTAIPGVTRRDDRTITVQADMPHLYRLFNLFLRVATAVTTNPPYC